MLAGKTTELLKRVERCDIAGQSYRIFKPIIDDRYDENKIVTHHGMSSEAIPVEESKDILNHTYEELEAVAIDEMQFFDKELVEVVKRLRKNKIRVIIAGLDLDFRGEPFPVSEKIICMAEFVDKLHGVCEVCSEIGTKTQRIINGEPAHYDSPTIVVGGSECYECRCTKHHKVKRG